MLDIIISDKIKEVCPLITLGCIRASVKVESSNDELLKQLDIYSNNLKKITLEDISSLTRMFPVVLTVGEEGQYYKRGENIGKT